MARKIRIVGICTILLIIIGAIFSINAIQSREIGNVEKVSLDNATDSSIQISWKEVSSAEGYYVYISPHGKDEYKKVGEFKSQNSHTAKGKINDLKQATQYDFYVKAFKKYHNEIIESKNQVVISIITPPSQQKIAVNSRDDGLLNIEWDKNSKATGYEIQYIDCEAKNDSDFKNATMKFVDDSSVDEKEFEKLEVGTLYSVRVRSYIGDGKQRINGLWSDTKSVKISKKIEMPSDIDPKKPMIALTFDDGPGYNNASDEIIDVLEKYGARATFFMVGQNAADHPKNVKRKVALKCEIGNHTYDHKLYGAKITASSIKKASNAIENAGGVAPTAFRSPGGITTDVIRKECKKENMPLYYWTLDTEDWKYRNADSVYKKVMKNVKDGDIILMHEIYESTSEAVERIVPELIKQGYQLVTCSELVEYKTGEKPVAGQQYLNATTIKNETR